MSGRVEEIIFLLLCATVPRKLQWKSDPFSWLLALDCGSGVWEHVDEYCGLYFVEGVSCVGIVRWHCPFPHCLGRVCV